MRRAGILLIVVLISGGALALSWRPAPDRIAAGQAQPGDDPALLRELAERELSPPITAPGGPSMRVRLLPGALPPDLPLALPLPPRSRLIGSVVRPLPPPGTQSVEVVLDAAGAPSDVVAFYRDALGPLGWTPAPVNGPPPGGFLPAASASQTFCASPGQPTINLNTAATADGPTDVRVNVTSGPPGPCGIVPGQPFFPPGADLLPPLLPPAGVAVQASGNRGLGGLWSADGAIADTQLTTGDLHDFYAQQLTADGWTQLDHGADGPLVWSRWTLPNAEGWQGFLYVREGATPAQRLLHVEVVSAQIPPMVK